MVFHAKIIFGGEHNSSCRIIDSGDNGVGLVVFNFFAGVFKICSFDGFNVLGFFEGGLDNFVVIFGEGDFHKIIIA